MNVQECESLSYLRSDRIYTIPFDGICPEPPDIFMVRSLGPRALDAEHVRLRLPRASMEEARIR